MYTPVTSIYVVLFDKMKSIVAASATYYDDIISDMASCYNPFPANNMGGLKVKIRLISRERILLYMKNGQPREWVQYTLLDADHDHAGAESVLSERGEDDRSPVTRRGCLRQRRAAGVEWDAVCW